MTFLTEPTHEAIMKLALKQELCKAYALKSTSTKLQGVNEQYLWGAGVPPRHHSLPGPHYPETDTLQ